MAEPWLRPARVRQTVAALVLAVAAAGAGAGPPHRGVTGEGALHIEPLRGEGALHHEPLRQDAEPAQHAAGPPASPPSASRPAARHDSPQSRPAERETIAQARLRLLPPAPPPRPRPTPRRRGRPAPVQERKPEPPRRVSVEEIALLAAIDFTLALGRADGGRAADLVDVLGYQPLPLAGDLPEDPPALVSRDAFRTLVSARPATRYDQLPADTFVVCRREALRGLFPALAEWMLAADFAVVFQPDPGAPEWVRQPAGLVIRLRAGKPTILGGNLLTALPP
jgi:hypothetical protein